MKSIKNILFCIATLALFNSTISANEINDKVSLNGIKEAKGVFLIDFTDVRTTAFYLRIIEGTHKGFIKQGVDPDLVLVFIGKTVKYLSTEQDEAFELENEDHLMSIQNSIQNLSELGVRLEVCAVATKVFNIDNKTIPKEMSIVADGFISLIGWQTQGYKLVPIF
jgi:intracellular sulfur oxidation DsrE/DsrF family protein